MQLEQAADALCPSTGYRRRAPGARTGAASAGMRLRAGHQALGGALEFEESGGAVALALVDRGDQVRDFVRQALGGACESPGRFRTAGSSRDAWRSRRCCARCRAAATSRISAWSRRDRIGHAHVRGRVEAEGAHRFLAQEGVVVDLGEALVDEDVAHLVLELALGIRRAARRPAPAAPAA